MNSLDWFIIIVYLPSTGLKGAGASLPFWAFIFGGIFLYTSYYGTDQSQVQRELSAATTADTKNRCCSMVLPVFL